jgi:hypothetical protein
VLVFEKTVESEVDLQDREVLEVLGNAVNREDFLYKGLFPHHLGALSYAALITVLAIDLPQPTSIAITSRTQSNLGVKAAEIKFLYVSLEVKRHGPSLNQKGDGLHLLISGSYLQFL